MPGAAARKSAEATPAPRSAEPGKANDRRRVQTSLKLSDPGDAAEREAVSTARAVMRMSDPVAPRARVPMLAARAPSAAPAPSKAKKDEVSPELTAEIKSLAGSGRPLSPDTRSFLEPRFKANFAGVRVHTGGKAENLATRLGARAFTYGKDIFFNAGAYQPDSPEGMELIAHELTHTIQQREVVQRELVQREEAVTVQQRTGPEVQRGIVSEALDWIADKANVIPGFRLFTIIIGRNPINMSSVDRSGANILRALIEFIPGGGLVVQALENHGIFEKGGKFIEDQFAALRNLGGAVRDALMEFIDSLGWRDIFRLGSLWSRAKRIFTDPIDKAIAFGKGLVTGIATLVKDAIIKPLGRWAASNIPKWNLLVGVFGKNPISDEGESPASQLIGAFMELIGQQEIWKNIKQGNAVDKAWAWFQKAMKGALSLVTSIPGRVMSTIRSLTIFDIVTLVGAFQKIVGAFSSFVGDFIGWAGGTVLSLLEIIFSVVAPQVVPYLKKAGGAFSKIIKAPGTFISTLVKAGKQGFNQFRAKFVTYLRDALFKWLLGSAEGAGIYFPKSFAPLELLKLGLSVLGLTWANLRAKLVKATNETVVKALEEGFQIVKTLVTEGPAAAWQELLKSLSNLKNMVVDAAIDFVKGEVVKIAIEKLVSMLTPAGAFIQAIISIYRTITFIVDKLAQIGRLVAAFIDGIAALANGIVGAAANKVESVLAQGLSLAISFLANFAGLGNIPKKVMQLIKKIQAPVDKAMDKVVTWIVSGAKKLGKMISATAKDLWKKIFRKRGFAAVDGAHNSWVDEGGEPMVASELMPLKTRLSTWRGLVGSKIDAAKQGEVRGMIGTADGLRVTISKKSMEVVKAQRADDEKTIRRVQPEIDTAYGQLLPILGKLFTAFGETKSTTTARIDIDFSSIFNRYDTEVLPLKRGRPVLVTGSPKTIYSQVQATWNAAQAKIKAGVNPGYLIRMAQGSRFQMERVLAAARNVGTTTYPQLTGVEVFVPSQTVAEEILKGTRIDYTVRDKARNKVINVAVEVKRFGRKQEDASIADQIRKLTRQARASLETTDPGYDMVRVEIGNFSNLTVFFQTELINLEAALTALAAAKKKKFELKRM